MNILDSLFGKTSPELSQATVEKTSRQSCRRLPTLSEMPMIQFLDLRRGGGNLLGAYWDTVGALPGVCMTLNTGEFPSAVRESTLSQILQANAPDRYSLSGKAALGILRRAKKRGKDLPSMLLEALTETCRFAGLDVNDADLPDDGEEFEDGVFTMDDNEEYDE
jgi:hypothetical protein